MTPQEIKQNMTQGEWYYVEGTTIRTLQDDIVADIVACAPADYFDSVDFFPANAAAIVTAVNGTYGVGIDPSKVKEMYELLQSMNNHLKQWSVIKSDSPYVVDIVNLLNSAKL